MPLKKIIHWLFSVMMCSKGISGVVEVGLAMAVFVLNKEAIRGFLFSLQEMSVAGLCLPLNGGGCRLAPYFVSEINDFSQHTKIFIGVYLLFYGLVNIFLAVALLAKRLWAYPAAMAAFTVFTAYLCLRFLFTRSPLLLFFAAFDVLLIALTWLEYRRLANALNSAQQPVQY